MSRAQNTVLEFGTGGIRGIMGLGANHMNEQTVKRVVQGFCDYINATVLPDKKQRGVVIAYDSRNNSVLFAQQASGVFAANHIPVFIFDGIETTPVLSFTIRHLKCIGGICITASHNPPQYNGIKVYWSDGAQIVPPQDEGIIEYINSIQHLANITTAEFSSALKNGLIKYVDAHVHDAYFEDLLNTLNSVSSRGLTAGARCSIDPAVKPRDDSALSIIYTPLHGTGYKPVTRLFELLHLKNVFVVPEQAQPDGNFPTVKKPNPEEPDSLNLAVKYATDRDADVIFATDPDSDRLAVCVKDAKRAHGVYKNQSKGDYVLLNGNQTGALLLDFILSSKKRLDTLKPQHQVIKTMVTTGLLDHICKSYDIIIFNTPTGFKWIAELIRQWETSNSDYKFLFGAEESFGYMFANDVRDKDALAAIAFTARMAQYFKKQNLTLCDALFNLFEKFGVWQEDLISFEYEPTAHGMQKIAQIMAHFRKNPPPSFKEHFSSQKLDMLQYILDDGSLISVRPSGTEPKLKVYLSVCTKRATVEEALKQTHDKIQCLRYEIIAYVQQSIS